MIKVGRGVDLAFALVVLASYFATFSGLVNVSMLEVALMIWLGITYITIGIYGYGLAARADSLALHLAYFVVQILLGGCIVYLGKGAGFNALVLLPLAGHSVILLPQIWMYVVNMLIVLVYVLSVQFFAVSWETVWAGLPVFLAGQVFIVIFTQMAVGEEKARTEVERLVKELEEANQRLRQYALQIEELAVARERNRMAREIHDGLGHYLTTIHMQIQAARAVMSSEPQRTLDALTKALNLTQEALVDVRSSVAALRAPAEEDFPLTERIHKLFESLPAEISPSLKVSGVPRPLLPQTEWTIYRAVQESLNNACKHSQATQLKVALDYLEDAQVRLTVSDNGIGAEKLNGGFGLLGLQERVLLLNGEFKTITSVGNGFTLEIVVPG